jgi:Uma2 family endonuclease
MRRPTREGTMAMRVRSKLIDYPESDGQPMAETDDHRLLIIDVTQRLLARYADRADVYVSGNLFVYYREGDPSAVLAPDAFVVFGVPNRTRRSYKVWREGRYPDVVFEFTSARSQDQDLGNKLDVYQDVWKVKEYFLFDPLEEYLDPSLVGYRMVRGELQPMRLVKGTLTSKVLGLTLSRDGTQLRLRDAATGADVLTAAEQKAAKAQQRVAEVEEEVARLKAELAALRKQKPSA